MANHSGKKESTFFLYTIIPLSLLLTLLFVKVNHNAVHPKTALSGSRPATEHVMEKPAEHATEAAADTMHSDTTKVMMHSEPAVEGAAEHH